MYPGTLMYHGIFERYHGTLMYHGIFERYHGALKYNGNCFTMYYGTLEMYCSTLKCTVYISFGIWYDAKIQHIIQIEQ